MTAVRYSWVARAEVSEQCRQNPPDSLPGVQGDSTLTNQRLTILPEVNYYARRNLRRRP